MTTEFDVGPLTWVKAEIDLALGRAGSALDQFDASVASGMIDSTQIRFCCTHLHQVHGALTIVGMEGLTQFVEALEGLLETLETRPDTDGGTTLVRRALEAIGLYLDGALNGQPNQPLRLWPMYREIQSMRGLVHFSPSDLFFPDLSVHPTREGEFKKLAQNDLNLLLKQARARFQHELLAWLRTPQDKRRVKKMRMVIQHIEETQELGAARTFWRIAGGFFAALAEEGGIEDEASAKQLCARVDLQIRRLLEGSRNVAERLMRDALYQVAVSKSRVAAVGQIKQAYHLETFLPAGDSAFPDVARSSIARLRDLFTTMEEAWNKFCAGSVPALSGFKENAQLLPGLVKPLGQADFLRLAQSVTAAALWLSEDSKRHSDALAMEIATAILLMQNARAAYPQLGGDFAHQVDLIVKRIEACVAGNALPDTEVPLLDEISRRAHEKLLLGQVAKEIQVNLLQIEQALDGFFRDTEKRAKLTSLETPFRQINGALTMLRQDSALASMQGCLEAVRRFSDPAYTPAEDELEQLASCLSMLGFFVEALPRGVTDFENFARQMQTRGAPVAEAREAETVEEEVAQSRRKTHALLEALKEQPQDASLREKIRQNLETLKNDADLLADAKLGEQAEAMLTALSSGADMASQIDRALATMKPEADALPPSQETLKLSRASRDEIDAELLVIFLEEAREVLEAVDTHLHSLKKYSHDIEALTVVRRSFHTLKGSGRMVGLKALGETAWTIEQTLNLWLRLELDASALIDLLDEAYALFTAWVDHLERQEGSTPDPASLIAHAESLRASVDAVTTSFTGLVSQESALPQETLLPEIPREESTDVLPEPITGGPPRSQEKTVPEARTFKEETTDILPEPLAEDRPETGFREESTDILPEPIAEEPDLQEETSPGIVSAPEVPDIPGASGRISISPALFAIFSEEASGYLHTLRQKLPALEREDATPSEMYRAAHTLAGISATVGLSPLNQLGHALEYALLRRDKAENPGSLQALGVVQRAVVELEMMFSSLAGQRDIDIPTELIEEIDQLYPHSDTRPSPFQDESMEVVEIGDMPEVEDDPESTDSPARTSPSEPQAPAIPLVHDEIDAQLLPVFLEEAADLNQTIAEQIRMWRANPGNEEIVRVLARHLHTLKGSARMTGAMTLGEITHALETQIGKTVKTGVVSMEVIDGIETAFESIRQIIERLHRGEQLEPAPLIPSVAETSAVPETTELQGAPEIPDTPDVPDSTNVPVAPVAPVVSTASAASVVSVTVGTENEVVPAQATLRVRASLVDRLANEVGELSITRSRIEGEMRGMKESLLDLTENVSRLRHQLREIEMQAEVQMQSGAASTDEKHADFDPLEFDRFTRFQELTRMMAESVNDVSTVQQNLFRNMDNANAAIIAQARQNREVHQGLMSMRMMPFSRLTDRLYRVIRQASKDLGKRANLEIRGGQVELDRSVLEKIVGPLEHLLRNSVAHGIEKSEERAARGKPETGEITLSLKQEGNEIVLQLLDDGIGLNYERIHERAVAAHMIGADEVVDEAKLAEFIFAPGFSTADELSQTAGRGIGMDVVKTELTRLGGRVEVDSEPGRGTEFRLILPLTLVVTKALLIRAGSMQFALPSSTIEQVLDLKEADILKLQEKRIAEWQSQSYPFSYLPQLLGDPSAIPERRKKYWVLLLHSGKRRVAIQVDELLGNQEIVVKNIGPQLARVPGVAGATVLGNGQVVLILNPVILTTRAQSEVARRNGATLAPARVSTMPTVMVVDDSLTVRKITGRLMAREGYQVMLAKDGIDALEQLVDVMPDVILIDIEMPRMDGFDLTRNIRADARLRGLPIIAITSRTAEKHREYAASIGIDHYLGKPYQEEELLNLVAQYVTRKGKENP